MTVSLQARWVRIALVLLTTAVVGSPLLAKRRDYPEDKSITCVGRLGEQRFERLVEAGGQEHIFKGDGLFRRRKYAEAGKHYEAFAKAHPDDPAAGYALLMLGVCEIRARNYRDAYVALEAVVEKHPKDAMLGHYFRAIALRELEKELGARKSFEAFLEAAGEDFWNERMLYEARTWLKRHYDQTRRYNDAHQKRWHELMVAIVKSDPSKPEFRQLYDFYELQRDWKGARWVLGLKHPQAEAEAEFLRILLRTINYDADRWAQHPERLARFKEKVKPRLADAHRRASAFEDSAPKVYRNLYFDLVRTCTNLGWADKAGTMMTDWMAEHPDDRVALYAYGGYVLDGAVDEAAFDKVFFAWFDAHPKDAATAEVYVNGLREHTDDVDKLLGVLERFDASPWKYGQFWYDKDDAKATKHYMEVVERGKDKPERIRRAAERAARWLYEQQRWAEAKEHFARSGIREAPYYIGECLAKMGKWREACDVWRDRGRRIRNRHYSGLSGYRYAEVLAEHVDKTKPEQFKELWEALRWAARHRRREIREKAAALAEKHQVDLEEKPN